MNVMIEVGSNYITGSISARSSLPDINNWRRFISEALRYALQGKEVYLFTLSPQKYSLGYELGSFSESRVGEEKVLINYFETLTDLVLSEIVSSEEFERGLLKIVISDKEMSFRNIDFVKSDYAGLKEELITLEDDGLSFYWYNPHFPKDQIRQRLIELRNK